MSRSKWFLVQAAVAVCGGIVAGSLLHSLRKPIREKVELPSVGSSKIGVDTGRRSERALRKADIFSPDSSGKSNVALPDKHTKPLESDPERRHALIETVFGFRNQVGAIEAFKITPDELQVLDQAALRFAERMQKICAKHIKQDFLRHDPSAHRFAFRLPAFPEGEKELRSFHEELNSKLGEERAHELGVHFNHDAFGSCGKTEVLVLFVPDANGKLNWRSRTFDPTTGISDGGSGSTFFSQFERRYGPILQIED